MNKNYVYRHYDPETLETVYIGIGVGSRAWSTSVQGNFRKKEHSDWFLMQEAKGYLAGDCVEVLARQLTKQQARDLEKQLILEEQPVFNIHKGKGSMTSPELVSKAKQLRESGLSYSGIATEMSLGSSMTAWRYVHA